MKKICVALLLCSLCAGTAHAKDVYYESFKDAKTGRQIEYIDLNEDTTRPYFTQNMWFNDNNAFIVGGESNHQIYKYDISTKKATALFGEDYLPLDNAAVVGPDNRVYARNTSNGNIYAKEVIPGAEETETKVLSMTLPFRDNYTVDEVHTDDEGEGYTENGLTFWLNNVNRWRNSVTVARERGGKWCRATVCQRRSDGNTSLWFDYYSYNYTVVSSHMSYTVDNSIIGTDQRNITIEFDYYDDDNSELSGKNIEIKYLKYNNGGKPTEGTAFGPKLTGSKTWKTAKVQLTDAQFDKSGAINDGGGHKFDFRIGIGYNRGGFASTWIKVYPTPVNDVTNLGYAQGGWHPHVSSNGDLSLTTGSAAKIVIYEAKNAKFATTDVWVNSQHAIINPVYPHLVLYSYDNTGDTNLNFDRIRLFNRNTMFKGCIFNQYKNSSNGATTGEAVGHESWSLNGEYIVAVKYRKDTNVGKSGIIRMDKNGENREYINDDYKYWHCAASPDGRWIVADTEDEQTNIVLIDAKTGKSYLLARQQLFWDDPGQPHPSFSADGTKVTFAMARRKLNSSDENYVMGVGIIDVSDIVNDDQIPEPAGPTDFRVSPFKIWYNPTLKRNEVTTTIENADGVKRDMNLYSAVFDADGRLVEADVNRYYSSDDGTLSTEIKSLNDGETLKCFLWDDDETPIKSSTDTIKLLRAAKTGPNEISLSWQHDADLPVIKYEVFRGDVKIGETPFTVFRDSGLTKETQYTYYVRPIYNGFHVGEDGKEVSVNVDDLDMSVENYSAPGSRVTGSKAGIKASTISDTMSVDMAGSDITETGMHFVYNPSDKTKDGYTKTSNKGLISGKDCRETTGDATSMFCFKLDKRIVPEQNNTAVDITVEYYNSGGGKLQLTYPATDGTTKTVDIASLSSWGASWKTTTVSVTDAKFNGSLKRNADFIIDSTKSGIGVRSVKVVKKSASAARANRQFAEWSTAAVDGMSLVSGGTVSGDLVGITSSDSMKFSVDDNYLYGGGDNMVWVDVTYKDQGTGKIYLYYNTSDPTATTRTDKQARDVITCTNTGELKTARIALIDAGFVNLDGYDFRIGTDSSAYISSVRVAGY